MSKQRSPEIFLSKKDIKTFFKLTDAEITKLVRLKILVPAKGTIMFSLSNILKGTLHLYNQKNK